MKISIRNRLAVLMRQRQINSASEFARRMTAAGYPLSSSHASRYDKDTAPAFDTKFIGTACNVLQCLPNDLYEITVELNPGENIDPLIVLPRHAIVLRRETPVAEEPAVSPLDATTMNIPPTASTTKSKRRQQTTKTTSDASRDSGPTGTIFPFIKE